jgi:hypothetical protein
MSESRSQPRSIRVPHQILEIADRILPLFPEATSQADLLRLAVMRGISLMQAEAAAAGHNLDDVAPLKATLYRTLLPVILWMVREGYFADLFAVQAKDSPQGQQGKRGVPRSEDIDGQAADDMAGLGADFLWD